MRHRIHTRLIACLCLSLMALAELGPARDLILCQAPGEHVAIEDAAASARCHSAAAEEPTAAGYPTVLSDAPPDCIDTPLIQSYVQTGSSPTASELLRHPLRFVSASLVVSDPALVSAVRAPGRAAVTQNGIQRLLRSVILLV